MVPVDPKTTEKWANLLDGLSGNEKEIAETLLANQSKYFQDLGDDAKANVGAFTKFAFPMINKTYPSLVASNLVSVQPMTGPVGGIAFYKPRYGSNTGAIQPGYGGIPVDEDGKPIYALNIAVKSLKELVVNGVKCFVVGIITEFKENKYGQMYAIVEDGETAQTFEFFFHEIEKVSLLEVVAAAASATTAVSVPSPAV